MGGSPTQKKLSDAPTLSALRRDLPLQNNANNEESCSTPTPGEDSQSEGHRK